MSHPEVTVSLLSNSGVCEDEDCAHYSKQHYTGQSRHCSKYPERKGWFCVRIEIQFSGQTTQVFNGLGRDVIEVYAVTDSVNN